MMAATAFTPTAPWLQHSVSSPPISCPEPMPYPSLCPQHFQQQICFRRHAICSNKLLNFFVPTRSLNPCSMHDFTAIFASNSPHKEMPLKRELDGVITTNAPRRRLLTQRLGPAVQAALTSWKCSRTTRATSARPRKSLACIATPSAAPSPSSSWIPPDPQRHAPPSPPASARGVPPSSLCQRSPACDKITTAALLNSLVRSVRDLSAIAVYIPLITERPIRRPNRRTESNAPMAPSRPRCSTPSSTLLHRPGNRVQPHQAHLPASSSRSFPQDHSLAPTKPSASKTP